MRTSRPLWLLFPALYVASCTKSANKQPSPKGTVIDNNHLSKTPIARIDAFIGYSIDSSYLDPPYADVAKATGVYFTVSYFQSNQKDIVVFNSSFVTQLSNDSVNTGYGVSVSEAISDTFAFSTSNVYYKYPVKYTLSDNLYVTWVYYTPYCPDFITHDCQFVGIKAP